MDWGVALIMGTVTVLLLHQSTAKRRPKYGVAYPEIYCTDRHCTYTFKLPANHQRTQCPPSNRGLGNKIIKLSEKMDTIFMHMDQQNVSGSVNELIQKLYSLEELIQMQHQMQSKIKETIEQQGKQLQEIRNYLHGEHLSGDPTDCQDILLYVSSKLGIYEIRPVNFTSKFYVYCEAGWTVIQRREDGTTNFNQDWEHYKEGFGRLSNEFWLGNEYIHAISSQKSYKLLVEIADWSDNSAHAIYSNFSLRDEASQYQISLGEYITGTAGDGLRFHEKINPQGSLNNQPFSTLDKDNDQSNNRNCAETYQGGWWYNNCHWANLNGQYIWEGRQKGDAFSWFPWKLSHYSLKRSKMKIKPVA